MKNQANVRIANETGRKLRAVSVVHMYSDVFRERSTWGNLGAGSHSDPSLDLKVNYNTGFGTTGRDWWLVTWEYDGTDQLFYTDPDNLRDFVDGLEIGFSFSIPIGLAAISGAVGTVAGPATAAAAVGGAVAGSIIAEKAFNNARTGGFKQHILRSDDSNQVTFIAIKSNNEVEFRSKSGNSSTGSSSKKAYDRPFTMFPDPVSVVTVFQHANFKGASQAFGIGSHDINTLNIVGNDQISSIKVPAGLKVVVFGDARFQGNSRTYTQDVGFTSDFNDRISSLIVSKA